MHGEDNLVFMSISVCSQCVCVFLYMSVYLCIQCVRELIKYSFPWLAPGHFNCPWLLSVTGLLPNYNTHTHPCKPNIQNYCGWNTQALRKAEKDTNIDGCTSILKIFTNQCAPPLSCIDSALPPSEPPLEIAAKMLSWLIIGPGSGLCL